MKFSRGTRIFVKGGVMEVRYRVICQSEKSGHRIVVEGGWVKAGDLEGWGREFRAVRLEVMRQRVKVGW